MKCDVDEFRKWHQNRLKELYTGAILVKLTRDREQFMAKAKWFCCTKKK